MLNHSGTSMTIYNLGQIVGSAFPQAFTPRNIISGFNKTGIYPFNSDIFNEDDFLPSTVTDRPNPDGESNTKVLQPDLSQTSYALTDKPTTVTTTNYIQEVINGDLLPVISTSDVQSTPKERETRIVQIATPEDILPYPKAGPRKRQRKGGKKTRKTLILTDTPIKKQLEEELKEKELKNTKKEVKLFTSKKNDCKRQKKCKTVIESSEDEDEWFSSGTSSNLELEPITDDEERPVREGDWVLIVFKQKKSVCRFVGLIESKVSFDEWNVKFVRHVEGSKFKWPDVEDISVIDEYQIEKILTNPNFQMKNDRVTGFVFKEKFEGLIVE